MPMTTEIEATQAPQKEAKTQLNVYVRQSVRTAVAAASARAGMSVSEWVERAIVAKLSRRRKAA